MQEIIETLKKAHKREIEALYLKYEIEGQQATYINFAIILLGNILNEEQFHKIIKIAINNSSKIEIIKEIYKYLFDTDISHVTNKYDKMTDSEFNPAQMLHEIAKYHFKIRN